MGLVDACTLGLWWPFVLPYILMGRVPEAGIVYGGDVEVLGHAGDPGGKALLASMIVGDDKRHLGVSISSDLFFLHHHKRTLILESWGMVGCPSLPGTVTSKTPKSFLVMGVASRSQLLKSPMR